MHMGRARKLASAHTSWGEGTRTGAGRGRSTGGGGGGGGGGSSYATTGAGAGSGATTRLGLGAGARVALQPAYLRRLFVYHLGRHQIMALRVRASQRVQRVRRVVCAEDARFELFDGVRFLAPASTVAECGLEHNALVYCAQVPRVMLEGRDGAAQTLPTEASEWVLAAWVREHVAASARATLDRYLVNHPN